jgi:hypothetical protein
MASAEHLLHEAQYAFQCISFGESRENKRNTARAKSLCNKIIQKFPATKEAAEAHAILRRLGEEAYSSEMSLRHRHLPETAHHRAPSSVKVPQRLSAGNGNVATLDWSGLIARVLMIPKAVLAMIAFAGFFLFGILGPFLFVPLLALVLLTRPFRQMLKPEQRKEIEALIVRANAFIAEQRNSNS